MKRHYVTRLAGLVLCGQSELFALDVTRNENMVTCVKCLRIIGGSE